MLLQLRSFQPDLTISVSTNVVSTSMDVTFFFDKLDAKPKKTALKKIKVVMIYTDFLDILI
jgi:hypothetical protein